MKNCPTHVESSVTREQAEKNTFMGPTRGPVCNQQPGIGMSLALKTVSLAFFFLLQATFNNRT